MNSKLSVVIAVVLGIVMIFLGGKVLKDKIAKQVIEEFRRGYTPGPYQPGFDPDKVNPNAFTQPPVTKPAHGEMPSPKSWNEMWEAQRY